jgi:flavin reductase (DIM6/NTAB) family NADH-FMN oxidoreductase RutF
VLAADQQEIADRFAGASGLTGADRFRDERWLVLSSGAICLAGSAAVFDCEVDERIERHTQAIVIGRNSQAGSRLQGARAGIGGEPNEGVHVPLRRRQDQDRRHVNL